MQSARGKQPGVSIDAGPGIPAAIGLMRVIHPDGNHVIVVAAEVDMRGEVIEKRNVTIRTVAQRLAVDPHLAILVDAIELEGELFVLVRFGHAKALAVPANSSRQIATTRTGGFSLVERSFDTPVVGKIEELPRRARKVGGARVGKPPAEEPPAKIKTFADSRSTDLGRRLAVTGTDE